MKNVDKKAVGARIKQIRINKGYTFRRVWEDIFF